MTISNKLAQSRIDKLDTLSDIILNELNLQDTEVQRNFSVRSHLVQITLENYHIDFAMKPDYITVDTFTVKVITPSVYDWYVIFKGEPMTYNDLLNNKKLKDTITSHECTSTYF